MTALKVIPGAEPVEVVHDGKLILATGKNRYETKWQNGTMSWSNLLKKLKKSLETHETHAEYMKMSKDRQDQIKDIGGFVGGHLIGGHRRNGTVRARQIITLDADFAPADLWSELMDNYELDMAMAVYSTHKHTPETPRLRLIIPLDREVTPDEYEAIARKIADKIGIDYFDDTTFQPTRLMFWPSHSTDVDPYFAFYDSKWLSADDVLAEYPNWMDVSYWPMSSRVDELHRKSAEKAGDPLEKPGMIGAFCQTYTIQQAIETFLPDIYTPTDKEDRYTYAAGSTAAGLVIYNDGLFAYSNHSTDPAGGQLCNAFDLVRIHKFGHMDDSIKEETPINKRPSFKEMQRFAQNDPDVRLMIAKTREAEAQADFADEPVEDQDQGWESKLEIKKDGTYQASGKNLLLILENRKELKGIRLNVMSSMLEAPVGSLPWQRDSKHWTNIDSDILYIWIVEKYQIQFPHEIFNKALNRVADKRRFHPIREYLESLPEWDGVPRVDTLLIDYFGAEDNDYTREAIRKWLVAAISRVYKPGVKFDYMLILNGPQGIGKSTFFAKLGGEWLTDNLTMSDMKDAKAAAEKIQGYWIIEIGEMVGMRKAEVEAVKSFVSRVEDIYRPAYGRTVERHPRECILAGTTNSDVGFLRDVTGNRRFWPIKVPGGGSKSVWDMTDDDVAQIWAEALNYYELGEPLILSQLPEQMARVAQKAAMEEDPRQAMVQAYLERLLPEKWDDMSVEARLMWLRGNEEGSIERKYVSITEIWVECLEQKESEITKQDREAIRAIMIQMPGWSDSSVTRIRLKAYDNQRARVYVRD